MLKIRYYTSFMKDYKRVVKRGYNIKLMEEMLRKSIENQGYKCSKKYISRRTKTNSIKK